MIPPRCGRWGHIPANVTGPMDAKILLTMLGCRITRECPDHINWWHFIAPPTWQVVVRDRFQFIVDAHGNARARLADCDPPELVALRFHHVDMRRVDYRGYHLLIGTASTAFGIVVCQTFRIVRKDINTEAKIVREQTEQFLRTFAPDAHNHFAYWDE